LSVQLKIKDVAELTGVAAATIRMWEQRYAFPTPSRTPAGYRVYTPDDVELIRRVLTLRRRGLSIPVAVEQARAQSSGVAAQPSLYASIASLDPSAHPRVLRRSTLDAMSHAIEDELVARAANGIVIGAFQRERHYRPVAHRYEHIALRSDAAVVFADFPALRTGLGTPAEVPIAVQDPLSNEWAVIVDSPGYAAALVAWERPNRLTGAERTFESILTLDPGTCRRAVTVAARLAGLRDADLGNRLTELLDQRPLSTDAPVAALTSLTNRMVAYIEDQATGETATVAA